MNTPQCHKCQWNGLSSDVCLSCLYQEKYSYKYSGKNVMYMADTFDPVQPDTSGSAKCTSLDESAEDRFRKALYDLFDLSYLEICTLKAIMNGKSMTELSEELSKIVKAHPDGISRFHAFQLRKAILKKRLFLLDSLQTKGQKKPLKG